MEALPTLLQPQKHLTAWFVAGITFLLLGAIATFLCLIISSVTGSSSVTFSWYITPFFCVVGVVIIITACRWRKTKVYEQSQEHVAQNNNFNSNPQSIIIANPYQQNECNNNILGTNTYYGRVPPPYEDYSNTNRNDLNEVVDLNDSVNSQSKWTFLFQFNLPGLGGG